MSEFMGELSASSKPYLPQSYNLDDQKQKEKNTANNSEQMLLREQVVPADVLLGKSTSHPKPLLPVSSHIYKKDLYYEPPRGEQKNYTPARRYDARGQSTTIGQPSHVNAAPPPQRLQQPKPPRGYRSSYAFQHSRAQPYPVPNTIVPQNRYSNPNPHSAPHTTAHYNIPPQNSAGRHGVAYYGAQPPGSRQLQHGVPMKYPKPQDVRLGWQRSDKDTTDIPADVLTEIIEFVKSRADHLHIGDAEEAQEIADFLHQEYGIQIHDGFRTWWVDIGDSIGFVWDAGSQEVLDAEWTENFECLKALGVDNVKVSTVTDDGVRIGTWCNTQRMEKKKGKLSPDRIQRLDSIGFVWEPSKKKS